MEQNNIASITLLESNADCLSIELAGRLDIHTTSSIWKQCIAAQEKYQPMLLKINAEKLEYCDGAGIALFSELSHRQKELEKQCQIDCLSQRLNTLLNMLINNEPPFQKPITKIRFSDRVRIHLGHLAIGVLDDIKEDVKFTGKICYEFFLLLLHPGSLRWKNTWKIAQKTGPNALPIIVLLGFLIGFITAFQSAIPLEKFGAQSFIGGLVGISLVREMGPLMTAIILASRTASSFAAEIGTMKINQEIDALTTMGLDSVKFLIIPRIIATTLMTPLLDIFLIFFGLIGCGIVMHTLGFSLNLYLQQLKEIITTGDLIGSLIKATTFGFLIASIGCLNGLRTRFGASAVGNSTTRSVVAAIIMIVIVDGLFAAIFYALGI